MNQGPLPVGQSAHESDRIQLNVGGVKYETYLTTLLSVPDTRLAWIAENYKQGSPPKEYFFDRHPAVFVHILNFYRTGRLHAPMDMCGSLFEDELQYWGIDEKQMEPCCWEHYTKHREAENHLRSFQGPGFEDLQDKTQRQWDLDDSTWWNRVRKRMWSMLKDPHNNKSGKVFSIISCALIMISVLFYVVRSMPRVQSLQEWKTLDKIVDASLLACFTAEFMFRFVFCPDKVSFMKYWINWVDLLSILPSYVSFMSSRSIRWIENFIILRVLRLLRFIQLSYGLQVLAHTLKASSHELGLLLMMLFIPVVLFSSVIHVVEKGLNEESTFTSIPESFWWCLITMTTVGYGDLVPKTWLGKMVGGVCAISGVLIVALPISVIGNNFSLFYAHVQARLKLPKKNRAMLGSIVRGLLAQPLSSRDKDRRHSKRQSFRGPVSCRADFNSSEAISQANPSSVTEPTNARLTNETNEQLGSLQPGYDHRGKLNVDRRRRVADVRQKNSSGGSSLFPGLPDVNLLSVSRESMVEPTPYAYEPKSVVPLSTAGAFATSLTKITTAASRSDENHQPRSEIGLSSARAMSIHRKDKHDYDPYRVRHNPSDGNNQEEDLCSIQDSELSRLIEDRRMYRTSSVQAVVPRISSRATLTSESKDSVEEPLDHVANGVSYPSSLSQQRSVDSLKEGSDASDSSVFEPSLLMRQKLKDIPIKNELIMRQSGSKCQNETSI